MDVARPSDFSPFVDAIVTSFYHMLVDMQIFAVYEMFISPLTNSTPHFSNVAPITFLTLKYIH